MTSGNENKKWFGMMLAIVVCLALLGTASGGQIIYLDGEATGNNDGSSWADAYNYFQDALAAALSGNEIWVKMGTYYPSEYIDVDERVRIYGGFDGTETAREQRDWENNVTTVDGRGQVQGFRVTRCATIDGFTITDCNAERTGAGMSIVHTQATIANCIFTDNHGYYGGAISIYESSSTITNCLFSGNTSLNGGGIYNYNSSPVVMNCTFSGNNADSKGGAIYNLDNLGSLSPSVTNCILWQDTAPLGPEIYGIVETNIRYCNIRQTGFAGGNGNINKLPYFVNPASGDYHLRTSSPCIDMGTNSTNWGLPDTDFEGDARIIDGDQDGLATVDIGADEYVPEGTPAVWYVDGDDGTDTVDCSGGRSWATAFKTLHKALECASFFDKIWVKQGVYYLYETIDMDKRVRIYGGFDGTETAREQRDWENNVTTVDGRGQVKGFYVTRCATIDGFTITDCNTEWPGGGMSISHTQAAIANCIFTDNHGYYGGAISISNSSPTITNCLFSGNTSLYGGAIKNGNSSTNILNCIISGNTANNNGGGIENISGFGLIIKNCILFGNSAGTYGGGIHNDSSLLVVMNCTFSGNNADSAGGAIYNLGSPSPSVTNCILWRDTASRGPEIRGIVETNIRYCDVDQDGYAGSDGNIRQDPLFVDPVNDDYRLQAYSPCTDAADGDAAPAADIVGTERYDDLGVANTGIGDPDYVDIGAYERGLRAPIFVDADATGANNGSSWADAYNFIRDALTTDDSYTIGLPVEVRVAEGIYKPGEDSAHPNGSGLKTSFFLKWGVTLKGGYAGFDHPDTNTRNIEQYKTILSGDLNGDDVGYLDDPSRNDNAWWVVKTTDTAATVVLDGFTVTSGSAETYYGGGMYNVRSSPTVLNCTFLRNSADRGGGMYSYKGGPKLFNCVFSGNLANKYGGGIGGYPSSPGLTNCTFSGNVAVMDGGGIYVQSGNPVVTNCIFWGNSDDDGIDESAQIYVTNGTPLINGCCIEGWTGTLGGTGNIGADPLFIDLDGPDNIVGTEDDDLRLSAGSPCIDAGDNDAVPLDTADVDGDGDTTELIPWDLDGKPRFIDDPDTVDTGNGTAPIVDMGAYEFGAWINDTPVYRFWSPVNSRHFYTIKEAEKDKLINIYAHVWTYESIAYYAFETDSMPGLVPVYRFWSPVLVAHFYTTSESERDKLINIYPHVWTYEGIAFYAYPEGQQPVDTLPVYRFWSPVLETHFYTMNEKEKSKLIDNYPHVWTYEHIAWYAYE